MADNTGAAKLLRERRKGLIAKVGKTDVAVKALGGIRVKDTTTRRKPKFTKAAQERIAAAQWKRWEAIKRRRRSSAKTNR
jgi:hypothetical protein